MSASPVPPPLSQTTRLLRFCAVGGSGVVVNMVVFSGVLAALPEATPAWLAHNTAAVLGFGVSCLGNFILNDFGTWGDRRQSSEMGLVRRIASYFLVAIGALVIQLLVLNATTGVLEQSLPAQHASWGPYLANLFGIGAGTVVNFVLNHLWTFRKREEA